MSEKKLHLETIKRTKYGSYAVLKRIGRIGEFEEIPLEDFLSSEKEKLKQLPTDHMLSLLSQTLSDPKQIFSIKERTSAGGVTFTALAIFYVMLTIVSNVLSGRLVQVGNIIFSGAFISFSFVYFFENIITEVYGFKRIRALNFFMILNNLFFYILLKIVLMMPYPHFFANANTYNTTLDIIGSVLISSIIAFSIGSFMNTYLLVKLRYKFGYSLWSRLLISSSLSFIFESYIFVILAFAKTMGAGIWYFGMQVFFKKITLELILLIPTIFICKLLKLYTPNICDKNTNLSPINIFDTDYLDVDPNSKWEFKST